MLAKPIAVERFQSIFRVRVPSEIARLDVQCRWPATRLATNGAPIGAAPAVRSNLSLPPLPATGAEKTPHGGQLLSWARCVRPSALQLEVEHP